MKATDEMAAAASVKNVDTSPERDKKGDDSLHVERVEAAARALYEYETGLGADSWDRAFEVERSLWKDQSRAALEAADEVVTEGRVEEVLYKAFQDWDEVDDLFAVQARAVMMLFRGGAK